jgi:RNA polymerase sigma factor (sigma-70 family)
MTSERQGSLNREDTQQCESMVRAIADGDRDSEREFVQRYLKPVRAMLVARSRNSDLAADLQQDVMIEAICALRRGQLREPAKLTSFVLAIARNTLNNYLRANSRTVALEFPDDLPEVNSEPARLEEQEWEPRALKAISSLDPVDRSILQLTLIDGLKPGAIAERLRINPDVVRQRKLRATRRVIAIVHGASQKGSQSHIVEERVQ